MSLPEPEQLIKSLGVHKMKYDVLSNWINFDNDSQHTIFVLDLTHYLGMAVRMYPDLTLATILTQSKFIDAIVIEILNTLGHYRNYYQNNNKKRFTGIVINSKPNSYQPLTEQLMIRLKDITDFIPGCFVMQNIKEVQTDEANAALVYRLLFQMYSRSERMKLNPSIFVYTSNKLLYPLTKMSDKVRLVHHTNNKEYLFENFSSIFLQIGIDPKLYSKVELQNAMISALAVFNILPMYLPEESTLGSIRKATRFDRLTKYLNAEGVGADSNQMVNNIIGELFKDLLDLNSIQKMKMITLNMMPENHLEFNDYINVIISTWKNKITDRRIHTIGDYLNGFQSDQELHIEWLL